MNASSAITAKTVVADSIRRLSEAWRAAIVAGDADDVLALYHGDAALLPPPPRLASVTAMPDGHEGHGAICDFVEG